MALLDSVLKNRVYIQVMSTSGETFTRARLAKKAGVGLEAIRFYERKGLLFPAFRDGSNYRRYWSESIDHLHFISKSKDLGFTLSEIKELQEIRELATSPCDEMRAQARTKLAQVDAKIKELRRIRSTLRTLLDECEQNKSAETCPILDGIAS